MMCAAGQRGHPKARVFNNKFFGYRAKEKINMVFINIAASPKASLSKLKRFLGTTLEAPPSFFFDISVLIWQ